MSELINNSEKRKELLKHMILQLHAGEAPELVRGRLVEILKKIPYDEVVEVEQELINGGLPAEEVLQFCDIHTQVLDGHIDLSGAKSIPAGHPVDTFIRENKELMKVISGLHELFTGFAGKIEEAMLNKVKAAFNSLMDVDKHYKRKEYLLFPYLEKYGVTGPPKVMWGKHDETRALLKNALAALSDPSLTGEKPIEDLIAKVLEPAMQAIEDMTMKEEEILFPMCMDKISELEWYSIYQQTIEFGYCLYDPSDKWSPAGISEEELPAAVKGKPGMVQLESGNFSVNELSAIFSTLPVDITFVDKDDKVRFFSMGPHRIFPRNRAILGRDVRLCHPPSSVDVVETILSDFKSGRQSSAAFWIQLHGKFIYIEYFALRDKDGSYLGTLEYSQEITALRALEGEQRLLSYTEMKNEIKVENDNKLHPSWFTESNVADRLDARPLLAAGEHPLAEVIRRTEQMEKGRIFELLTPFPPQPLIDKMKDLGFEVYTRQEGGLLYSYFCRE